MAKRRKVNNPLALAVLATVAERPMHPYEIASVLRERGKDESIEIKWGTLYTVVENLDKHGFIEAAGTVRAGRRPERTVYRVTNAGMAEMRDWLRELLGEPGKEYRRLAAGLDLAAGLPPDEVAELLQRRVRALDAQLAQRRARHAQWSEKLPRLFLIEDEYEMAILQAEADWVRSLLTELADGSLPGLAQWRALHDGGGMPPQWTSGGPEGPDGEAGD